jgi:large subunit ribosomal protein L23
MKLHTYDVIVVPNITEKEHRLNEQGKYVFRVHRRATKLDILNAVEEIFHVKVARVNTMNVQGKWRRLRSAPGKTAAWKKAIVTLKSGQKIEFA